MKYEIAREIFKQRLEDRQNFVFVDVGGPGVSFEGSESMPYDGAFAGTFGAKYPSKTQNVVVYSLRPGDENPERAADALAEGGYRFVYYYRGSEADVVLDKGLN